MLPFIARSRRRFKPPPKGVYGASLEDVAFLKASTHYVPYIHPVAFPSGDYKPLMIIGGIPGEEDDLKRLPFRGNAGHKLDTWLKEGGFNRKVVLLSNVFRYRPEKGDVRSFFRPVKYPRVPVCQDLASHGNLYLAERMRPEIDFLKRTLIDFRPEVVITLGPVALWAILNQDISVVRFSGPEEKPHFCTLLHGEQVARFILLPAYHPAEVLKSGNPSYENVSLRAFKQARKILRPASL